MCVLLNILYTQFDILADWNADIQETSNEHDGVSSFCSPSL